MTDEEFGRAWAAQHGHAPDHIVVTAGPQWGWQPDGFSGAKTCGAVPVAVAQYIPAAWYDTEAAAYAALGRAVRAVHAAVPPLAGGES